MISSQSGAAKATLMLLNTAVISHRPEKNIQMGVCHLCWEDCSHTSRQGLATGFCSLCPQLCAIKHRYKGAHWSSSFQHSAAVWRYQYLPFFRFAGWKYLVSTNYYIPRLKNYSFAQNAVSISVSWRQGTRLNELHLSSETWEAQPAHSVWDWLSQSD